MEREDPMAQRRLGVLAGIVLLALVAGPLFAGTVYVPIVNLVGPHGEQLQTQIWVSNTDQKNGLDVTYYFIPDFTNGLDRPTDSTHAQIAPGTTIFLEGFAPSGTRGLLELSGADSMQVSAKLSRIDSRAPSAFGTSLPVISSSTMIPAGQTAELQGLERSSDGIISNFGVVNLGQSPVSCQASAFHADGTQIGGTATLAFNPLTLVHFDDVLNVLGETDVTGVRVDINCDQPFYPYSVVYGSSTGDIFVGLPAASGASLLSPPGSLPNCGSGSVCYDYPGIVFTSTPADTYQFITLSPPSGVYSQIKVHLEIQINGWSPPVTNAHGLLYMIRDRNYDMYASAFLRGPNSNQLVLRHGFNQTAGDKAKLVTGFAPTLGNWYALDYLYDPINKTIVLTMSTLDGQVLAKLTGTPNVKQINIDPGQNILIGLSNPGTNDSEPASIGWVYSNLHVELVP